VTDPTGSALPEPDLPWPFERPQWFLGTWTKARWLSLLDANHHWYLHHAWRARHHWPH
jgi:hypothetical protein